MTAVLIGDKEEGKERSYGIPPQVGWSQVPGHLGRAALGAGGADVQKQKPFTLFISLLKAETVLIHNKL